MPISETPWKDLLPAALRMPLAAYNNRHFLWWLWSEAGRQTGLGKTRVLVTGRPGAGKSVLFDHITGTTGQRDWKKPDASIRTESHNLQIGEWHSIVRILPGQLNQDRAAGIEGGFESSALKGVVHVVDWGFSQPTDPVVRAKLANSLTPTAQGSTIPALLSHNREQELQDFRRIVDRIQTAHKLRQRPRWLVVAVNKADLFLDRLEEAQDYYHPHGSGPFAAVLRELQESIGRDNLSISVVPVAPHPEPFHWNQEVWPAQMSNENERRALMNHLLLRLAEVSSDG